MKKYLLLFALFLTGMALSTSCSSDDEEEVPEVLKENVFYINFDDGTKAEISQFAEVLYHVTEDAGKLKYVVNFAGANSGTIVFTYDNKTNKATDGTVGLAIDTDDYDLPESDITITDVVFDHNVMTFNLSGKTSTDSHDGKTHKKCSVKAKIKATQSA